ncbi:MAG: glycosyltransferase [Thermodesulfobacteriota bacterium]|nr:glycosyltransferase [Thermodesulfobacteriota bacterium]
MKKPLIFIPTYNEAGTILFLLRRIQDLDLAADLLFIDDASPDGTGRILDDLAAQADNIQVIHRAGKSGIGSAHLAAMEYARSHGYARLITMDGDLSHSPEDIPRLLAGSREYAVVIGSRFAGSGSRDLQHPGRRLASRCAHLAVRWLLGVPYDAGSAFRVYDLERISPGVLGPVRAAGYAFFFESLFFLVTSGIRIRQVPVAVFPRKAGGSKMSVGAALRWWRQLILLWLRRLMHNHKVTFL